MSRRLTLSIAFDEARNGTSSSHEARIEDRLPGLCKYGPTPRSAARLKPMIEAKCI